METQSSVFLRAEWQNLLMMNFEIDPAILDPYIPAGTELDFYGGRCYVSLVGFLFQDTRVLGLPIPFHTNFEEINLRFYVVHRVDGEMRRGVVFVKEIVPRSLIALTARLLFNEHYISLPTANTILLPTDGQQKGRVEYQWELEDRWNSMGAEIVGSPHPVEEGSEEQFIMEHYWGYTKQQDGGTLEYRVDHPRWNVWEVGQTSLDCDVSKLYGEEFVPALSKEPTSCFVAEGSPIAVRQPHAIQT